MLRVQKLYLILPVALFLLKTINLVALAHDLTVWIKVNL